MRSDERNGFVELRRVLADAAIRPPEIGSPPSAEDFTRGFGLLKPLVDRSVAPSLPRGQIAQAHDQAERDVTRDRPTHPNLEVIRMRTERNQINAQGSGLKAQGSKTQRETSASSLEM
jgi:hypothetical protein